MENLKEIRWKQRFQNFEKAFKRLSEAVNMLPELDDLGKEGLIQRFEYTFELSWKIIKDYLESEGVDVKFPRDVLKKAFEYELIDEGELWLSMLKDRNLLAHTYDEKQFKEALVKINDLYFPQIVKLDAFFLGKINE